MRADRLDENNPARIMLVGYPGSGKTGSLAPLVDAGFKLRILDFDGNYEPLLKFTKDREKLANVDILTFEDKLRMGGKFMETVGLPQAYQGALRAMDNWKYTDEDGTEVDLGKSKDWGLDTIVVVDSLTAMGEAAMRHAMAMTNKTPLNRTQQTWGLAQSLQDQFMEKLTAKSVKHHVIVLAHLKMIGPKDAAKDDDEFSKNLKERIADLVPTRLFPSALGQALPPTIGGHFPTLLLAEADYKLGKPHRSIKTVTRPDLDLKVAAPDLPPVLPIEDAMVTLFKKLSPKAWETLGASGTSASTKEE